MRPYQELLDYLVKDPYITNKDLSQKLGVSPQVVSSMIGVLNRNGYIETEKFFKERKVEVLERVFHNNYSRKNNLYPKYNVTDSTLLEMFYNYFLESYKKKNLYYMQTIYMLAKEVALFLESRKIIKTSDLDMFITMRKYMDNIEMEEIDKKIEEVYL